ncbi:MAG: hypothetical protein ABIY70_15540 [Capsulimonas sp.]|uniref:hypothetical protein n=1 Tax=Capsulimonas sp. TaxID=2494211 RepID=UPI0032675538
MKTIHGQFQWRKQRLLSSAGQSVSLKLISSSLKSEEKRNGTAAGSQETDIEKESNKESNIGCHLSVGLRELCCFYSTKVSYSEVADLVERLAGQRLLCDQSIWNIVEAKACAISRDLQEQALETMGSMPLINTQVDVYSSDPEVLVYTDAILVTRQKPKRLSASKKETQLEEITSEKTSHPYVPALEVRPFGSKQTASGRVSTDVVMLERRAGGFEYVTSAIGSDGTERISLVDLSRAFLRREYGCVPSDEGFFSGSLSVVAITDGASSIRTQLLQIFGHAITVVLDWFHLCKKVREKMTMISRTKDEKIAHLRRLLPLLWRGNVGEAIVYLRDGLTPRNGKVRDDLIGYLEKHAWEIIDYEKRRDAGKSIGSGRMEKGVDQIVGQRQKQKAMSWSDRGSKALALLHTALLNGNWQTSSNHGLLITA